MSRQLICSLVFLCLHSTGMGQSTAAQTDIERLQADQLDYYLQQAIHARDAESRLKLNHIGIQGRNTDAGFLVTAVLETYPAHEAGIYRGDILRSANGEDFHPVFSFNDSTRAPGGFQKRTASVSLDVLRGTEEHQLTVMPVFENLYDSYRSASLNSVQQFPSGNKMVGYLRLWVLSRASTDLLAYQELFSDLANSDGIILDLRDAVGFVDANQLDLLFRGSSDLFSVNNDEALSVSNPIASYRLQTNYSPYRRPVAILINEASRGGPELLAYQLDKLSRVVSLGSTTAGRLGNWRMVEGDMIYQLVPALEIDGTVMESRGYSPEQQVDYPQNQAGRIDPQFQAAMDILMGII